MLKHKNVLLVLGIIFIASNLRTPLTDGNLPQRIRPERAPKKSPPGYKPNSKTSTTITTSATTFSPAAMFLPYGKPSAPAAGGKPALALCPAPGTWYENFIQYIDTIRQKQDERFIRMWS